ncbi:hypothetical protein MKX03_036132 [Papaver bracteatum]|nr:hypothetical protein MKX03_036132 [Papaver bracteatum]
MLRTLPSKYLKWVSKTLRARDFKEWAQLVDQVLVDHILINGNEISSGKNVKTHVSDLLEISERFGLDNDDKIGWSKINFELLAISFSSDDDDEDSKGSREKKFGGLSNRKQRLKRGLELRKMKLDFVANKKKEIDHHQHQHQHQHRLDRDNDDDK